MALTSFTSALRNTAPKLVTPKKFIYNIVSENNFETLFWMLAGRKMSDMLRSGSEIRAAIKFESGSQADNYDIGTGTFTPGISQDGQNATAYWHGHMGYDGYREDVVDINAGGSGDDDTIEETWTQEIFNMWQSLYTAIHKSFSLGFWRPPNPANMGRQGDKYQASIPYMLNDHVGLPATHGGATAGAQRYSLFNTGTSQFRTLWGVDVGAQPRFVPHVQLYGTGNTGFTPNVLTNLVFALDMSVRKTSFKAPPINRKYFDDDMESSIDQSGGVIFASAKGIAGLFSVYLNSNDRWADTMDPYGQPKYKGIPAVYEAQLDVQPLYLAAGGASTTTEMAADIAGPRYYGVNAKRFRAYFHKNRFMKLLQPLNSREDPLFFTQYVNSLMSTLCWDRSKHFILTPADDQTTIAAL